MNVDEQRRAVIEAMEGCERLLSQIAESQIRLDRLAPFSARDITKLDGQDWDALYAFQMKFLLLQDLASRRLLRGFLALSGEDPRDFSHREMVDRAAALGAIDSADVWLALTAVRNMIAHDYPVDLVQFATRLDDAWIRYDDLTRNVRRLIDTLGSGDFL